MNICIYGAARDQIDSSYIKAAEKFGSDLASRGHTLVFGGGGGGVMGATARGAEQAGGEIISVLPAGMNIDEKKFHGKDTKIYTKDLAERKARFMELSDAFVMMPGGIGTFDEFFDLLSVKGLGDWTDGCGTDMSEKPLAIFNVNGYYDIMKQLMENTISQRFAGEWIRGLYRFCENETELWQCLEGFPEECCDAAEVSDTEYRCWEQGRDRGFWVSYLSEAKEDKK